MFKAGKYKRAADCFLQRSDRIALTPRTSPIVRYRKGRMMRNAAICLGKAANKAKDPQQTAYLREQGVDVLSRYLKDRLYEVPLRARQAQALKQQFYKLIQYGSLTLTTDHATRICLRGFQYRQCEDAASWKGSLRPGVWTVRIAFSNKAELVRTVTLPPRGKRSINFQQPTAKVAVTLVANDKNARFRLFGRSLPTPLEHKGTRWRQLLLPGQYKLRLHYPGKGGVYWHRRFVVHKQAPKTLAWNPAKPGIYFTSMPSGASISINGVKQGQTPLRLLLRKGRHKVHVKSPCYQSWKRTFSIPRKSSKHRFHIVQTPGVALQSHLSYKGIVSSQRALGVTTLVAGGALLLFGTTGQIVASVFHGQANDTEQQFNRRPVSGLANEYQQLASNGNLWRTIGTVGLGVGGVSVGLGIWRMATLPTVRPAPTQCRFDL